MPPPRTSRESLLFGGRDGRVACESFAVDGGCETADEAPSSTSFEAPFIAGVYHPDGYDRKDSTKGLANPKSSAANRKPRASSAAAAAAVAGGKPPVLVLPGAKIQTAGHARPGQRRPVQARIFPKKKGGGREPAVPEDEPGSPKVDCFGKVLSGRERGQRGPGTPGCWTGLVGVLGRVSVCDGGRQEVAEEITVVDRRAFVPSRNFLAETASGPLAEEQRRSAPNAVGLGSMRAYTSSRRTASWAAEVELVAGNPESGNDT